MKKLYFLLALLMPLTSICQNWDLFPATQRNYYGQMNDQGQQAIHSIQLNYAETIGSSEMLHYDKIGDYSQTCIDNVEEYYVQYLESHEDLFSNIFHEKVRLLEKVGTDYIYTPNFVGATGTFVMKADAIVGDTWLTVNNTITISCIASDQQDVLGLMDDVKTFEIIGGDYDGAQIILSKVFGLIEFIPFYAFFKTEEIYSSYILRGYENNSEVVGTTLPDFKSYFPLQVGDVTYWERSFSFGSPTFSTGYTILTILDKSETDTSVTYTYQEQKLNDEFNLFSTQEYSRTYLERNYRILKTKTSNWFYSGDFDFGYLLCNEDILVEDDIYQISRGLQPLGHIINGEGDCEVQDLLDSWGTESYNTYYGLYFFEDWDFGTYNKEEIIGSNINGIEEGTQVFLTTSDPESPRVYLYPNPTKEVIQLELPTITPNLQIELFNNLGQKIWIKNYEQEINLYDLPNGIYYLKVEGYTVERIVKI